MFKIPQFLLQNSQWKNQKCRILVSQPNSELATGAKFRLENNWFTIFLISSINVNTSINSIFLSSISTESCITFVTNKVLMKNFPSLSDPSFQITHLVLVIKCYIKYRFFNLSDQTTTKKG